MERYFPEKNSGNDYNNDVNNLVIQMTEVEGDDVEASNAQFPATFIDMLGDTGVQGYISPPSSYHKHGNGYVIVNMANGATAKIYKKDDYAIVEEVGNNVFLVNMRVVEGVTSPIVSLNQLTNEVINASFVCCRMVQGLIFLKEE